MLDDLGLIPTLRVYIEDFPKRPGRKILFSAFAGAEALHNDKRTVLYRVAQEALINAAKHSQAKVIKVSLLSVPGGVGLEIADNGRSFDVSRLTSARWNKRLGLIGMRERVEMVGGRFNIVSAPGAGTTIRAEIPFAENILGAVKVERIVGAAG
jgi:signal transduction histidine kinase